MKDSIEAELISFSTVQKLIGKASRQWIYTRLRSDPTFPRPLRITPHSIAFRRSKVMAWIDALPRAEFDGLDAIERRAA